MTGLFSLALAVTLSGSAVPPVELTPRDVAASNQKIGIAYKDLVSMWRADFEQIGARFSAPKLMRYRGTVSTPCGVMRAGNAFYCPRVNAIYFDEVFVAGLKKRAALELGTDGDMTAVGVVAHEVGHAVAMQLGYTSRFAYDNEAKADCLAGAFAFRAGQNGSLEEGDVEEAFYGMSAAGDPTPELTGETSIDRQILRRAALMGHGTREQRISNFRGGFEGGPGACMTQLRDVR